MTSTRQAFGRQRAQIEARVAQIQNTLATSPESWRSCLEPARNLIHEADTSSFVLDPRPLEEQIRLISTLQSLAYQDPDSGGEVDISSWCVRQWATVLHNHPDNLDALRGLGHAWLLRAQASLARIHHAEGSSSTSFSSPGSVGRVMDTGGHNGELADSANYIEARDFLRPSMDHYRRAVEVADSQDALDGELLVHAAEAYMSFGNVSRPQSNAEFYRQALQYLQRAAQIPGYNLEAHLQRYLDENMRLFE
ncbi:hypothetical protein MMC20_006142 [Loxospora ochrophaea]|nr:hypothetical protein [Loxospora ochrophaea]